MKKILMFLLSFILCVQPLCAIKIGSAATTPIVAETNANLNELTITGDAIAGDIIVLTVVYPERNLNELTANDFVENSKVIAYTDFLIATDDTYTFVARLLDVPFCLGGEFEIIVNKNGVEERTTHEFYYFSKKQDIIRDFNNPPAGKTDEQILEEAIEIYGLKEASLWVSGDAAKTLSALQIIKEREGGAFDIDPSQFAGFLEEAMLVSAVNSEKLELISTNGIIDDKLLDFFDSDTVDDYVNKIKDTYKEDVVKSLVGDSYDNMAEISEKFDELVAVNAIAHNVLNGSGHIPEILEDYRTIFVDAGFKIDKFESLSNSKKNIFLSEFNKNATADLSKMKTQFNKAFNSLEESGGSGGSGGSFGGSYSGGGQVTSDVKGNDGIIPPVVIKPSPFKDMSSHSWAADAVSVLYEAGVISGYSTEEFGPANNVTRAEFTKLIITLAELVSDEYKEDVNIEKSMFDDVSEDAWYCAVINKAADMGVVNGNGLNFNPEATVSREDAAVMLYRFLSQEMEFENEHYFDDEIEFSDYARGPISYMAGEKLINGVGNGTFNAKGVLTRAEAAMLIYNAYKEFGTEGVSK